MDLKFQRAARDLEYNTRTGQSSSALNLLAKKFTNWWPNSTEEP
jgi:hypothetical protein